jgi:hypothetical protein
MTGTGVEVVAMAAAAAEVVVVVTEGHSHADTTAFVYKGTCQRHSSAGANYHIAIEACLGCHS